jgi:malonyl-CoA O-methyltransferase
VTGYLIPTLTDAGELNHAERYADFLSWIQRPNGSFSGPDGREYAFDSGQALRGLVRASQQWPRFKPVAIKTAEYIVSVIGNDGHIPSIYDSDISENVHVFILPALMEAGQVFNKPQYIEIAKKSLKYYKNVPDILNPGQLTHFLAYIMDGFIDMGEQEFVRSQVKKIFLSQRRNGGIPAYPNCNWCCSAGVAQFAIIGYKLGLYLEADKAVDYLCHIQNPSGGFYGSYGFGAKYFPGEEISWANKFFIDSVHLKIAKSFDHNSKIFPREVSPDDGRLKAVLDCLENLDNNKILDAGCGKGRFTIEIKKLFPTCEIHGIDISEELLKEAPDWMIKKKGNILNLPYGDGIFDGVYCIEALEHIIRTEKAIEELCRVTKDGGQIIIIDKNVEKLGRLKITDFEQWFNKNQIKTLLEKYCQEVKVEEIGYDNHEADGLFLAWSGTKKAGSLSSTGWHEVMIGRNKVEDLVKKINSGEFPVWSRPLLEHTIQGDTVLELGSGTGEISAILGKYERIPYLMDYSKENIEFAKAVFKALGIKGNFNCADILDITSWKMEPVDWVWSSGLLEHFSDENILSILINSCKIARKGVMSLVPNARAIIYRAGKYEMEQEGTWPYGREDPKFTMKGYFEKAGLRNVKEYSVGPYHALEFSRKSKQEFKKFYDSLNRDELASLNQGYLLFTYGEK